MTVPIFQNYTFQAMKQSPKAMLIQLLFQVISHEDFSALPTSQKVAAFEFMVKMGEWP